MKMAMCTQQLNCLIWIDCFVLTLELLFNCVHSFLCAILQKKKRFINTQFTFDECRYDWYSFALKGVIM